jgi:IclR family KDG regulon transcriptional repressor
MTTKPAVKSAERALAIVEFVADQGSVTFAEVLDGLSLPRSSVHGLLGTLVAAGWLERHDDRRYVLGLRCWEVGQLYGGHRELVDLARPIMDEARTELGETVQLARLDGTDNVYIAISHSPHPMRLASSVGARLPSHATGIGKALLALLQPDELRRRLGSAPLMQMTARTITDVGQLLSAVDEARHRGYATDDSEYLEGCVCVAVPLGRDPRTGGSPVALSVTVPTSRLQKPWPGAYLETLQAAATGIRAEAGLVT